MNPFDKKDVKVPRFFKLFMEIGVRLGYAKRYESSTTVPPDANGWGVIVRGYKYKKKIYTLSWQSYNHNTGESGDWRNITENIDR